MTILKKKKTVLKNKKLKMMTNSNRKMIKIKDRESMQ